MPADKIYSAAGQRELGAKLRQLRLDSGFSVKGVASKTTISEPKLSRLERGLRGIRIDDVRELCKLYGLSSAETAELLAAMDETPRKEWWQDFRSVNGQLTTYLGLESAASAVRQFEGMRIPGLLQTEEFTRAMLPTLRPPGELTSAWIDDTVAARTRRQSRVSSGELRVEVVIDEAALSRPIGGVDVMRDQIDRLIRDGRRRNVTLQIIPFSRGPHPGIEGSFQLMHFPEGRIDDLVHVDGLLGDFIVDKEAEVARYRATFDHLRRRVAMRSRESIAWLMDRRDHADIWYG